MLSKLGKFTTKYALPLAMGVAVASTAVARIPSTVQQSKLDRYNHVIGGGTQYIDVMTINVRNPDNCGLFCNSMQHIKNMIDNEGLEIVFVQEHGDELDDLADAMGNWNYVEWDRGHGIISKFKLSGALSNSATVKAELKPGHFVKLSTVHLESRPYPSEDYYKNAEAESERNKFLNMAFDDHDEDGETRWEDILPPTNALWESNPDYWKFGIIAGDFNEPSHKDWAPNHGDRIYHADTDTYWPPSNIVDIMTGTDRFPISEHMQDRGFKDSYREIWPNPSTNPGTTYPGGILADSETDFIEYESGVMTTIPLYKRADRIDRIYYKDNTGGNLSVVNSYTMDAGYNSDNPVDKIMGSWDTDHRAVVTRFKYIPEGTPSGPPPGETWYNYALGKSTSQSSNINSYNDASRAVDGITDGNFSNNPGTHTNASYQPWWKVDLGGGKNLKGVTVWNRTDCCTDRLATFTLSYRNAGGSLIASRNVTFNTSQPSMYIPLVADGVSNVKIQIGSGTNKILSLAEVQVWGALSNHALGKTAYQSTTDHGGVASRAVDGNTSSVWWKNSVTHTATQDHPAWAVELGGDKNLKGVTVWNRTDCCKERLATFQVSYRRADWSYIATKDVTFDYGSSDSIYVPLEADGVDRVVIQAMGTGRILSIAEVQVWGE